MGEVAPQGPHTLRAQGASETEPTQTPRESARAASATASSNAAPWGGRAAGRRWAAAASESWVREGVHGSGRCGLGKNRDAASLPPTGEAAGFLAFPHMKWYQWLSRCAMKTVLLCDNFYRESPCTGARCSQPLFSCCR
eukprot:scaffold20527_cov24-Tisochrysis_lutea.AAC.3